MSGFITALLAVSIYILLIFVLLRGCKHNWKIVSSYYEKPPENFKFNGVGDVEQIINDALYGSTIVTSRCIKCNEIKVQKYVGKADVKPTIH